MPLKKNELAPGAAKPEQDAADPKGTFKKATEKLRPKKTAEKKQEDAPIQHTVKPVELVEHKTITKPAEETKAESVDSGIIKRKGQFLLYKGRPLVRSGNTLYYGSPDEPYLAVLQIAGSKPYKNLPISEKIVVLLMQTDPEIPTQEQIIQHCERRGLYNAVDIANVWLDRQIKKANV
jgi:hypothetical protein